MDIAPRLFQDCFSWALCALSGSVGVMLTASPADVQ
jgi:hypothetical protein